MGIVDKYSPSLFSIKNRPIENCEIVPRESCDPERVLPKIVVRPVVKKSCIKQDQKPIGFIDETICKLYPTIY